MKVNDRNLVGPMAESARTQETQRAEGHSRSGATRMGGGLDRVELSSAAGSIARALGADDSDRAARLSTIAADYQAGRYQPDSLATSRGLIAESQGGGLC